MVNTKLAVFSPVSKSKSVECLQYSEEQRDGEPLSPVSKFRQHSLASTNSLDMLDDDHDHLSDSQRFFTLKRGVFLEFTLQWASSTSCLSVYVVRLNSLPPKYHKSSCTLTLTLTSPPNREGGAVVTITKTSPRLRNATLNPECNYLFSYPEVSVEQLRQSMLVFGLQVRRSKHLLNKQVGELRYALGEANLQPDTPRTVTKPIMLKKKESSPWASVSSGAGSEAVWGQVQVAVQYQVTGTWQARIKVVLLRAQSAPHHKIYERPADLTDEDTLTRRRTTFIRACQVPVTWYWTATCTCPHTASLPAPLLTLAQGLDSYKSRNTSTVIMLYESCLVLKLMKLQVLLELQLGYIPMNPSRRGGRGTTAPVSKFRPQARFPNSLDCSMRPDKYQLQRFFPLR
nr:uncharacterized protein LOC128687090 [Cherax quadricarinatus]